MIKLKRVYDPARSDGYRILVDRLWPRGLTKTEANVDKWLKDIAPSDQLRRWFSHEVTRWPEFKRRYFAELAPKEDLLRPIIDQASENPVTLVYAARDPEHNNAVALKEYLDMLK